MTVQQSTDTQITTYIGNDHPKAGLRAVNYRTQPYDEAINQALLSLAESSFGALQIRQSTTAGYVQSMAGQTELDGVLLVHAGDSHDLATSYNNQTVIIWLQDAGGGTPQISIDLKSNGWPATSHFRLGEVVIAAGVVTSITDRRLENFRIGDLTAVGLTATADEINQLCDGIEADLDAAALNAIFASGVLMGTTGSTITVGLGTSTARLVMDTNSATGNFTLSLVPSNLTGDRVVTFPDVTGTLLTANSTATLTNKSVATPTSGTDLANKQYVDDNSDALPEGVDGDFLVYDTDAWTVLQLSALPALLELEIGEDVLAYSSRLQGIADVTLPPNVLWGTDSGELDFLDADAVRTLIGLGTAYAANIIAADADLSLTLPNSLTDSSGGSAGTTIAAITNAANAGSADVGPVADAIASILAELATTRAALDAAQNDINDLKAKMRTSTVLAT